MLLDPASGDGCRETAQAARRLGRPLLTPDPGPLSVVRVAAWLAEAGAQVLLVAGCRASLLDRAGEAAGARAQIADLIAAVARHDKAPAPRAGGELS